MRLTRNKKSINKKNKPIAGLQEIIHFAIAFSIWTYLDF